MKLRKKQIKVPKNLFVSRWRISVFYRGIFDFLGGCVGAIGVVEAIGRVTPCRDARECYLFRSRDAETEDGRIASRDVSELAGEVEADVREVLLCHLQDVATLR